MAAEFLASVNTDLKRDWVEMGTGLGEALDQLQQGEEFLGYHFTYCLPTKPVYANLDVNKLTQVPTNLVSNAFLLPTKTRYASWWKRALVAGASWSKAVAVAFP